MVHECSIHFYTIYLHPTRYHLYDVLRHPHTTIAGKDLGERLERETDVCQELSRRFFSVCRFCCWLWVKARDVDGTLVGYIVFE